jgi:hypothetical protein
MADWVKPTRENDNDSDSEDDRMPLPVGGDFEVRPVYKHHHLTTDWRGWSRDNMEALQELYTAYRVCGQRLFGGAFNQCGSFTLFAEYVYSTLQPGAL